MCPKDSTHTVCLRVHASFIPEISHAGAVKGLKKEGRDDEEEWELRRRFWKEGGKKRKRMLKKEEEEKEGVEEKNHEQ